MANIVIHFFDIIVCKAKPAYLCGLPFSIGKLKQQYYWGYVDRTCTYLVQNSSFTACAAIICYLISVQTKLGPAMMFDTIIYLFVFT